MSRRPGPSSDAYDMWTRNRLFKNSIEDADTGCLVWQGRINKVGGYGRIGYRYRQWRTHRLAYVLLLGPIPEGKELLHSCDNPRCINPLHLRAGTHAENILEAYRKGRKSVPRGPAHPRFKLTEEQVDEVMQSSESAPLIAARFGVSKHTVYKLRKGITWKARAAK